jgi:putative ABC transport system substrate-binding protein
MNRQRRRQLLAAGCALAVLPHVAAQQPRKLPRIGMLFLVSMSSGAGAAGIEGLRASLREFGYVEGRSILIEYRSAEGRAERLPELAAQLVAQKVDVIVTGGGNVSVLAARSATSTIPIVMSGSLDAVATGLVQSLPRPSGNITGLSVPRELASKQIELLRELVPSLARVGILVRGDPALAPQRAEAKVLAEQFLRVTLDFVEVPAPEQLAPAFAALRSSRAGALIVGPDPLFFQMQEEIVERARAAKLPAVYPFATFVEAGGLLSYSLSPREVARVVARHVDRILKGAKPAEIPVEEPTVYELVINLRTAKALGLKVSPTLLARADRVIE